MKIVVKGIDETKRAVSASTIKIGLETSEGPAMMELTLDACERLLAELRGAADGAMVLRQAFGSPPHTTYAMDNPQPMRSVMVGVLTDRKTLILEIAPHTGRTERFLLNENGARGLAASLLEQAELASTPPAPSSSH